ncbi:hypothetical protein AAIR29_09360 [Psychrobacter sp. FBL11]|uniref:Uncharacterized protein n=1 Tax=Psychrobacter saeujeotis TaxID=3143436 RepID=A0ABU9X8V8_9GAMM|nr:hypothetical protein [uncultured Psychrobacter sp.]
MRTIKDEQDLKKYIYNLERENESLKKSHSYRVGKSLISIKDNLLEKKFKNLVPASKRLLEATKKAEKKPSHVAIDIKKINSSVAKSKANPAAYINSIDIQDSIQHYFIPKTKYKKVVGVFFLDSSSISNEYTSILLTPDNYRETIAKSNIDFLIFDLQKLKDNPLWFAFGTHDSIFLLRSFVLSVKSQPSIVKVLIANEDITLFPLLMKLKDLGFFDVTQSTSFVA